MVTKYLVKKAREGWKFIDEAPHKARIAYAILMPGGTVIVPAYYGIQGIRAAMNYVNKVRREKGLREERIKESDLRRIVDYDSLGSE